MRVKGCRNFCSKPLHPTTQVFEGDRMVVDTHTVEFYPPHIQPHLTKEINLLWIRSSAASRKKGFLGVTLANPQGSLLAFLISIMQPAMGMLSSRDGLPWRTS